MSAAPDGTRASRRRRVKLESLISAPWQRCTAGAIGVTGVVGFAAWRIPLGLPGHRALGWLSVLLLARLIAGPGWSAIVGLAGAAAVLVLGISPDGIYGVADYAIAGILIDLALSVRPGIGRSALKLVLLGAIVL